MPSKKDGVIRIAIGVNDYNESELIAFATRGEIIDKWGNVKGDEPFVFRIDDVNQCIEVIKNGTVCSIHTKLYYDDTAAIDYNFTINDSF